MQDPMQRRMIGHRREDVTRELRKLHNKNPSRSVMKVRISKRMRMAGHIKLMGEMRNSYKIVLGKSKGKRLLERFRLT
jgi:hypothetical protein